MTTTIYTNQDDLETRANELRARLARTLEALDHRKHDAVNVKLQVSRHPLPFVLAGAGALVALVGGAGLSIYRSRQPPRGFLAEYTPQYVASAHRPSLVGEIARGVVITLATFAISRLARRALVKFFPELQKEMDAE